VIGWLAQSWTRSNMEQAGTSPAEHGIPIRAGRFGCGKESITHKVLKQQGI
jgi:hypothetical protein